MGEGRTAGVPWGHGPGKGKRDFNAFQRSEVCDTPSLCARRLRDHARRRGLGNPIERCLASTSWGNWRRVGRALQMVEHLADHLGLGDGGDHPQRSLMAKRKVARLPPPTQWRKTGSHIQSKHAPQRAGVAVLLAAAGAGSHAQGRQAVPLRMALEPLPTLASRGLLARW